MNDDELNEWLDEKWKAILSEPSDEDDPEIDRFVNSSVNSIRYAFVTQMLGKFANPTRVILCLQIGSADPEAESTGRWDPRSFCTKFVVPWVQRNHSVLGTSTDPYVSNPLRRRRLDENTGSLRNRSEWDALVKTLTELESASDESDVSDTLDRCLYSIARRLRQQEVDYPVPLRVSLDQLSALVDRFLETSHGGLRPQIVATALLRTIGRAFLIFSEVTGLGVNEPDSATGSPGDVMCYGPDDSIVLAVEVKGNELKLVELEATVSKARSSGVGNILFAAPALALEDSDAITRRIGEEWAQASNIYQISIQSLPRSSFMLLDEKWRVTFLREICDELDSRSTQPADRLEWASLLSG